MKSPMMKTKRNPNWVPLLFLKGEKGMAFNKSIHSNKNKVKFNKEKLEAALKKNGISKNKIAVVALDRNTSFIYDCIKYNCMMPEDDLKKLSEYLGVSYEKFIDMPEPVEVTVKKEPEMLSHSDSELLVVGMNCILEDQKAMVKILSDILTEIKASNQKINRLEEKLNHIENASGASVSNLMQIKDNLKESKQQLDYIRSNSRTIDCRLRDYIASQEKPAMKLVKTN